MSITTLPDYVLIPSDTAPPDEAILEVKLNKQRPGEYLYLYNGTEADFATAEDIFSQAFQAGIDTGVYASVAYVRDMVKTESLIPKDLSVVLDNKGAFWLIKDKNGVPAGFIAGSPLYDERLPQSPVWKLHKFYMTPAYQGCGAGKQLIKKMMQVGLARGYQAFYLETLVDFKDAQTLYRRAGFEIIPPVLVNYPDTIEMLCPSPAFALEDEHQPGTL